MKRTAIFIVLLTILSSCNKEAIDSLTSRVDALENNDIASIKEQISSISKSINDLKEVDKELNSAISILNGDFKDSLSKVENRFHLQIANLEKYVDDEFSKNKNWAEQTFSTLEQYRLTCDELASVKLKVTNLESDLTTKIENDIKTSESGMRGWINEKLTGYWTIAETQAKLIELSVADAQNMETLRGEMATLKSDLTTDYTNAITEAINTSEGKLNAKIDDINKALSVKISDIEKRLDAIEHRLDELEKIFSIEFMVSETIACMPGKSVELSYKLANVGEESQVECVGENGWSGKVIPTSIDKGTITVTAPDVEIDGKIVVIARSDNKLAMKSLYFEAGILSLVSDTYNVRWQGEVIEVPVSSNIRYDVDCGGVDWISFQNTKSITTKNYTLTVKENPEDSPARSAKITFSNDFGQVVKTITIFQELSPTSTPIVFKDQYAKEVCVKKFDLNADGELSYFEAGKVEALSENFFGEYAPAITEFSELQYFSSLKEIPKNAFYNVNRMTTVALPEISLIDYRAFCGCSSLSNITLPNSLTKIGEGAFFNCEKISNLEFPTSLIEIGANAFRGCGLKNVFLPEGLENVGTSAFYLCNEVDSVYFPSTVKVFGDHIFSSATGKIEVHSDIPYRSTYGSGVFEGSFFSEIYIGDDVSTIGSRAFYQCQTTQKIVIGKNVSTIAAEAFLTYSTYPYFYVRRFIPSAGSGIVQYKKIYVPSGSKEIYMAASGWPSTDTAYEEYQLPEE